MSARWIAAAAATAGGAALGAAAVPLASLGGLVLPWQVAVPAGVAAGLLLGLLGALPTIGAGALEPPPDRARAATSSTADLGALHFVLETSARDPDRFEYRLRPRLCDLAVDRLWLRRGLDWRAEADRAAAREMLGPHLVALLTAPPHSLRLTARALSDWLDELERL
jgi:hypothetical protein